MAGVGCHPNVGCDRSGMYPIVGMRYNLRGESPSYDLCQAEFDKLPDEEKAKYEKIAPPCSKSLQECEAAIADGNHDFEIIYDGVHRVIESSERDGLARFRTAVGALGGAATDKAVQRDEAAEVTTLLSDAALAKPAFDQLASCVAWATGAKLELLLLGVAVGAAWLDAIFRQRLVDVDEALRNGHPHDLRRHGLGERVRLVARLGPVRKVALVDEVSIQRDQQAVALADRHPHALGDHLQSLASDAEGLRLLQHP